MELFLFIFIAGIAFLILRIHYWEMKTVFCWALILLPPACLLPLAIYPMRNPLTMVIWMPAFIFLLGSILIFIYRLLLCLTNRHEKLLRLKLLRSALTIAVFIVVFSCHHISKNMAIAHAIDFAKDIQKTCDSTESCPASVENWYERK